MKKQIQNKQSKGLLHDFAIVVVIGVVITLGVFSIEVKAQGNSYVDTTYGISWIN